MGSLEVAPVVVKKSEFERIVVDITVQENPRTKCSCPNHRRAYSLVAATISEVFWKSKFPRTTASGRRRGERLAPKSDHGPEQ